uniref:Uncharacterized protein n=1 Tax=Anguilla anguilla TaxID=7936 RepID=A0A0E9VI56_ANGAN
MNICVNIVAAQVNIIDIPPSMFI